MVLSLPARQFLSATLENGSRHLPFHPQIRLPPVLLLCHLPPHLKHLFLPPLFLLFLMTQILFLT
jgi:hypothetical protein